MRFGGKSKYLIVFTSIILFFRGDCNQPQVDPDWRGMKILAIGDIASRGSPVCNEENIIYYCWQLDKNDNSFSVTVNLFSRDKNTHISLLGSKMISVTYGQYGDNYLLWDGKMIGSRDRKVPVPPGDYSVRLAYFDNGWKYVWHPITVRANTWDGDNDDISDAVETENVGGLGGPQTIIIYEGQSYGYNPVSNTEPPVLPLNIPSSSAWYLNRGTHDYSLARGTVSNGTLTNGIRIANSGTGYQYFWDNDPPDTDNWGTLELVNLVERVARDWSRQYPSYPIITSKDMSKEGGGSFGIHGSHENGLDVDIRYIRTDNSSNTVTIDDGAYGRERTQQLINLFHQLGNINVIYSSDNQLTGIQVLSGHRTHMHVRIFDPDGPN